MSTADAGTAGRPDPAAAGRVTPPAPSPAPGSRFPALGARPYLPALAHPRAARRARRDPGADRGGAQAGRPVRPRPGPGRSSARSRATACSSRWSRPDRAAHPGAAARRRGGGRRLDRRRGRSRDAALPARHPGRAGPAARRQVRRRWSSSAWPRARWSSGRRRWPSARRFPGRAGDPAVRHDPLAGGRAAAAGASSRCTWPPAWPPWPRSGWPSPPSPSTRSARSPPSWCSRSPARYPTTCRSSRSSTRTCPRTGGSRLTRCSGRRSPGRIGHGLVSFGIYAVIFCAVAWARFTRADVTS